MMSIIAVKIILLAALISASAFFSSAEMALFSLDRAKLAAFNASGTKIGKVIFKLMEKYNRTLVTIILSNMFVNSCISMLNDDIIRQSGLNETAASIVSALIAVIILLMFGEITPMTLAYVHREQWSAVVALPVAFLRKILLPLTMLVEAVSEKALDLLGRAKSSPLSQDEYEIYLDKCSANGAFTESESEFLKDTLEFSVKNIGSIMCPRVAMAFAKKTDTFDKVISAAREKRQTVVAIGTTHPDDADSIIAITDIFTLNGEERKNWLNRAKPAVFHPAVAPIMTILAEMKKTKTSVFLLSDEYGGIAGIITLHEILLRLMDVTTHFIIKRPKRINANEWLFDGLTPIEFVFEQIGFTYDKCSSNTLNGLFCELLNSFPEKNKTVQAGKMSITAMEISGKRAALLKVALNKNPDSENEYES